MPKALNLRPCQRSNSTQKSESMLEESNQSNQYPTKLKPSKLNNFSNHSEPSPLDLTISNKTMIVAATVEDEKAIKATVATMVETTAMATTLVIKAKTTKIADELPMIRISPVSYMEGDTVIRRSHFW